METFTCRFTTDMDALWISLPAAGRLWNIHSEERARTEHTSKSPSAGFAGGRGFVSIIFSLTTLTALATKEGFFECATAVLTYSGVPICFLLPFFLLLGFFRSKPLLHIRVIAIKESISRGDFKGNVVSSVALDRSVLLQCQQTISGSDGKNMICNNDFLRRFVTILPAANQSPICLKRIGFASS